MEKNILLVVLTVVIHVVFTCATVTLDFQDVAYLPISYNPTSFQYNVDAAEQFAIDPRQGQYYAYIVGANNLHVVDFSDARNLRIIDSAHRTVSGGSFTDVEACGDYLAASFQNYVSPAEGKVNIYRLYQGANQPLEFMRSLIVGAEPDMILFTKDCKKLVVAVEGEPRMVDGVWTDYEGMVTVVSFSDTPGTGSFTVNMLDFTSFNSRADEYVSRGVRWVLGGARAPLGNTFSQDLEPEYIAINTEQTTAYVVLQEANAVAIVDLETETITEIEPLGFKSWRPIGGLDASDRDDGINIQPWEVKGAFEPDGMKYVTINGDNYLITADEGDVKDYEDDMGFTEAVRARTLFRDGAFAESVSDELKNDMNSNSRLGRLDLSQVDPLDDEGKLTEAISFGGRSFSLFKINANNTLTRSWSSDNMLETIIATEYPEVFNSNPNNEDLTPEEAYDRRSDNRGPEPESVAFGNVNGRDVIFIGIERPGMLSAWTLNSAGVPQFESIHYNGGYGSTYEQLYDNRIARDLDPEDIRFLAAEKSPTGQPMLLVSAAYTGTLSTYNVVEIESAPHPKSTKTETKNFP